MSKQCCRPTSSASDIDPNNEAYRNLIVRLRATNTDLLAALETLRRECRGVPTRGADSNWWNALHKADASIARLKGEA